MKTILRRAALIVFFIPCVVWTIIGRIASELKDIPFYCWCDIRGEWGSFVRFWRDDTATTPREKQ